MDVNAQNFAQELPAIEAAIANSDFMSFDTEMTGLNRGSDRPIPFESPSSRYQRVRGSSEGFLILQFGLACFRFDAPTSSYEVTTFNFYIFPQQIFSVDRRFHCQTGSLRFLASHNFDFNQTFYKGIPFLDRVEEAKVRQETEQHSARIATPQQRSDLSLKDEDKAWLTERVATLTAWKATAASGAVMKFERCSPYHRRILYQEMPKHFPDVKLETIRAEECIAASFPTAEQMQVREREKRDKLEAEFLASLGFTRVIRAMQATRKPIVGHNMLLDSIHMWEQFESPLPASLDDFKAGFRAVWPAVYDTKHIASVSPVLNKLVTATSLEDAAARTLREPFTPVTLRSVHDKYGGDVTKAHEAGYDAFLTGSLFLRMCHHLHYSSTPSENPTTLPLAALLPHLSAFRNRIPIARADTSFNLEGPEEKPDRTNLIYVSGMAKAIGQAELTPVLSKFCPVRFIWVNDTATFVQLEDATQVLPLLRHLREGGLDPIALPGVTAVDFATYETASAGNDAPHQSESKSTPKPAARKRTSDSIPAASEATPTKAADSTPRADAEMEDGEWQASGAKKAKRKRKVSAGKGGGGEI